MSIAPERVGSCLFTIRIAGFALDISRIAGLASRVMDFIIFTASFSFLSRIMLQTASLSSGAFDLWRPIDFNLLFIPPFLFRRLQERQGLFFHQVDDEQRNVSLNFCVPDVESTCFPIWCTSRVLIFEP